ncbi:hypothetical protein BH24DEI2_BH24DEI2_18340 [soil metagenome]
MVRLKTNSLYNRRLDGRPSDVLCGVDIGMFAMPARFAMKFSLGFSVAFLAVSAYRTGTRRIASLDQTKQHAITNGAVFDEHSKLIETPTTMLRPLRLFEPYPVTNARKVFELKLTSGALSRFNEVLCNSVVRVAAKPRFSTCYFFQPTFSALGPALLQRRAVALELLAFRFDLCASKRFAVRGGSKLSHPEVNAERARGFLRWLILKLAVQMDIPLTFLPSDELSALNKLSAVQQVSLIVADTQRHLQAPVDSRQAQYFVFER